MWLCATTGSSHAWATLPPTPWDFIEIVHTCLHWDMLWHAVYQIKTLLIIRTGHYYNTASEQLSHLQHRSRKLCLSPYRLLNCSKYINIYDLSCFCATYVDMDGERELKKGMGGYINDNGYIMTMKTTATNDWTSTRYHPSCIIIID